MSMIFKTRKEAFNQGFIYAGREDLIDCDYKNDKNIKICNDFNLYSLSLKKKEDSVILEFVNKNNISVKLVSCKFRQGYDLWLCANTGECFRV